MPERKEEKASSSEGNKAASTSNESDECGAFKFRRLCTCKWKFRNSCMNRLRKVAVEIRTENEHLWRRVIEAKYGNESGVCSHSVEGPYGVNFWKFIQQGWLTFSKFLQFDVGDGTKVKFRHDMWCGDCPLKVAFPELFSISHHKESSIDDVLHFSNGCPIGMFDSLDWSKIESLWLLL